MRCVKEFFRFTKEGIRLILPYLQLHEITFRCGIGDCIFCLLLYHLSARNRYMEKKPDYLRKRKGLVMHWFLLILLIHLVEGVEISCFVHKELLSLNCKTPSIELTSGARLGSTSTLPSPLNFILVPYFCGQCIREYIYSHSG